MKIITLTDPQRYVWKNPCPNHDRDPNIKNTVDSNAILRYINIRLLRTFTVRYTMPGVHISPDPRLFRRMAFCLDGLLGQWGGVPGRQTKAWWTATALCHHQEYFERMVCRDSPCATPTVGQLMRREPSPHQKMGHRARRRPTRCGEGDTLTSGSRQSQ